MIRELDTVVLTHDADYDLRRGDVGTVIHCYTGEGVYEVEFVTAEGSTIAVLTLSGADIRPIGNNDVLHVRELAHTLA